MELTERILAMSGKEYRRVFRESPLVRPGRKGMLRNVCVALGNCGATSPQAGVRVRPALERAASDGSELVREHAVWGAFPVKPRNPELKSGVAVAPTRVLSELVHFDTPYRDTHEATYSSDSGTPRIHDLHRV